MLDVEDLVGTNTDGRGPAGGTARKRHDTGLAVQLGATLRETGAVYWRGS